MIRSIRFTPFAIAAGIAAYALFALAGAGPFWSPLLAAIAAGWTLGRLMREPGIS